MSNIEIETAFESTRQLRCADFEVELFQPRRHGDDRKIGFMGGKVPDGIPGVFLPGIYVDDGDIKSVGNRRMFRTPFTIIWAQFLLA